MKKKIAILGAGESGVGAAILAVLQGFEVFVSDKGEIKPSFKNELEKINVEYEEGKHSFERILQSDIVVKSPGIADKYEIIQAIKSKNICIISEIEFAYQYCTDSKTIAITGTNGKSTTTTLIHHILTFAGLNAIICGNIGNSFAREVAKNLNNKNVIYVIEISSFQLDDIITFKPNFAVLLNITPDHLDRYDYKLENYVDSKFRICKNQDEKDVFIYWNEDILIQEWLSKNMIKAEKISFGKKPLHTNDPQAFIENNQLIIKDKNTLTMNILDFAIKGEHNSQNNMAASIIANRMDIRKELIRESLSNFKSLEHRMEDAGTVNGIQFINDSKATNVNAAWYALEAVEGPIIWIAGGVDKGNDYSSLTSLIKSKVKAIVCMGKDNRKIHEAFGNYVELIVNTSSADEAVKVAHYLGSKGDKVLLAPACASFDLFENYEDRGKQFKAAVNNLKFN